MEVLDLESHKRMLANTLTTFKVTLLLIAAGVGFSAHLSEKRNLRMEAAAAQAQEQARLAALSG